MKGCLVAKVNVNNNNCFFICLFMSPIQNSDEVNQFSINLDMLLSNINNLNPNCSIHFLNFNRKCSE